MLDRDDKSSPSIERRKLVEDFHDIAGYTLTTAIVQIDAIRRLMARDPESGLRKLDHLHDFMRQGLSEIRASLQSLHEGKVDFDLAEAISRLFESTQDSTGVEMSAAIPSSLPSMSCAHKSALFGAVREGIANGIRHGECTRIALTLDMDPDALELVVSNDGKPYEGSRPGIGLTAMQRRIGTLGGSVRLSSTEQYGCELRIRLPV